MLCPIAGYRIDERAARVVAGLVVLLLLGASAASPPSALAILLFLALDFGFRAFSRPRLSPLGRLAGLLLGAVGAQKRLVDAGPKRFAARIGLGFSLALLILVPVGLRAVALSLGGVFLVCAALESFVGFCAGCWVWGLWWRLRSE